MRLDALRAQPGLLAAVLVGPDGLPLEMIGEGELLAAELAALRAWTERVGEPLGAGRVTRLALTTEQIEVVALASGPYLLGAALTRGLDTRPVQQALAQLALEAAELPEPEGR
ncbi:Roadblock/LC7 domain-containing protein [Deinococcus reticulitermitis]|uniref:Roadblock/LC7 domain-containing protein n=1 Tax=Deinococcus reticulitermitis TaxID=856736 RepID=A0A1H6WMD4_9DEIO|nr:roadblock/LC7 domain-containing protein [Deinococcus reticulitermitis]SEJ16916.1 Roadblock/LC7 domain-containing protein [Deinococcus reticulitermitis]